MAIEHRIVTFVSAKDALEMIKSKKLGEIRAANPLPKEPKKLGEKATDEEKKAHNEKLEVWKAECIRIEEKINDELESAMAQITLTEEEGHAELPDDYIVRSRIKERCKVVGCGNKVGRTHARTGNTKKQRRHSRPFCGKVEHSSLRGQIPRKNTFFILRGNAEKGILLPA